MKTPSEAPLGSPPVRLGDDDALVRACLAQGGFPRAERTHIGTVWFGPGGEPWTGAAVKKSRSR